MAARAYPADDLDGVLAHTSAFFSHFRGARVLITGGTGFIGSWLVQALQRANDTLSTGLELVILTRDVARIRAQAGTVFARPDTQLIQADVGRGLPPVGRFDLCIHAATDVSDPGRAGDLLQQYATIVDGTRRVLDLALATGTRRLLLVSSGAIYGPQPATLDWIAEDYAGAPNPLAPTQAYGNSKRMAEWLACAYAQQAGAGALEVCIARIFAVVGPGLPFDGPFAAGNFIRDTMAGRPLVIQGDGRPLRSFLYMSDLCIWLLRMLDVGRSGEAYNVGGRHAVSIAELARAVVAAAGTDTPIVIQTPTNATTPAPRYLPDTRKARSTLDLDDYTPLDLALRKTMTWTRAA